MPKRTDLKKILVIGSGPIVIGQAAEFDYAGTQACLALKEEEYEVILINSNPATIMTDKEVADRVYIEPITLEFVSKILYMEQPDAILPSLGGQTGLNMAIELNDSGILNELDIELIGTNLDAIEKAENRESFRSLMETLGQPVPESEIVNAVDQALEFCEKVGYPIIVRPAYTLGGTGGGICHNEKELKEIVGNGLALSPVTQCLIEVSIAGYKEIEYEVMRDSNSESLVICGMENFDPVGIHTGDSIVFAPNQSLTDEEESLLSNVSLKIIEALEIKGGCNVQLALHPETLDYYVIEVNPRVSRSSALASKATGFPIAKVSAKIAVGYNFDELYNSETNITFDQYDASEIKYTVAKIPRWSADKFKDSDRNLTTQMKATGEVMAIGQSIEESLLKAVRSLELGGSHLWLEESSKAADDELFEEMTHPKDDRIFYLTEALRRGFDLNEIYEQTQITPLFLKAISHIIAVEENLKANPKSIEVLKNAKKQGISDETIASLWRIKIDEVTNFRKRHQILPSYLPVTIWNTESENSSSYRYSSYNGKKQQINTDKPSILVLGSGPIRIGQGIEFDYATVHSVKAIQQTGYEAIVVNSNPETVSTDFSISDKLYFEPLTLEDVMGIIENEQPEGVIVQFGGQTAINLAEALETRGVKILGTTVEDMSRAENRDSFEKAMKELNILQPKGVTALTVAEALAIPEKIDGYPVLVRPSYVLGGRGMEVVKNDEELEKYMQDAIDETGANPVLIDHYIQGTEVEVDAVSDGENVLIPGIMEHIESSGVHSGDSMAVYPPQTLSEKEQRTIVDYTTKLCKGLNTVGMMNIQFIIQNGEVYVIEVNPRASRTVPFLSKITGIPMAQVATKAVLGESIIQQAYEPGIHVISNDDIHVKAPVFSFSKLNEVDPKLGPEMKSTGEVMGSGKTYEQALYKAFVGSGTQMQSYGSIVFVSNREYLDVLSPLAAELSYLGYNIVSEENLAGKLEENGVYSKAILTNESSSEENTIDYIKSHSIQMIVNTNGYSNEESNNSKAMRLAAISRNIPLITSIDTFKILVQVLKSQNYSVLAL